MTKELTPFGFDLIPDELGMLSLNKIYKIAGSPANKDPRSWIRLEGTIQLVDALIDILNVSKNHIIKTAKGKGGGTSAHKNLSLSYAKYLDPKLATLVNEIAFERFEEEKNPQLAIDRAKNTWRKQGKSDKWIGMRLMSMEERKSFTGTLKGHGVTGIGYRDCTNAIYKSLWGGGAEIVRLKKNIPSGSNYRDFMTEVELAGVRLAELLAAENIELYNAQGNKEVEMYCESASKNIAIAIMNNRQHKKFENK